MSREVDDLQQQWLLGIALLIGSVVPISLTTLMSRYAPSWLLVHELLAALVLGWSAVTALLSALFIMLMRKHLEETAPRSLWIAAALTGMGIFDGFNAGGALQEAVGLLSNLAALVGGLLFALILLPERLAQKTTFNWLPCFTAACCVLLGISFLFHPEYIPAAQIAAPVLSVIGGFGFFLAGLHFSLQKNSPFQENVRLAGCSFALASAAFFSPFTPQWDATWWCWYLLRLIAIVLFLCLFIHRSQESILKLRTSRDNIENSRKQLADLIENSPSAVTLKDISGRFVMVNRRFEEFFHIKKQDVVGKFAADVLPHLTRKLQPCCGRTELSTEYEESIFLEEGTKTFLTTCFPLADTLENAYCVGCIQTDITEHRKLEQQLRLDEKILANTEEAIVITDAEAMIVDVNEAYTKIMGYTRDEVVGKNPRVSKSGHHNKAFYKAMWQELVNTGTWSGEIWDRRKNGEVFEKWLTINAIRDSNNAIVNYVGIFTDISEKRNAERKLRNLLFYDSLTKLPNRTLLHERLEQAILSSQSHDIPLALFCIDLDRFKDINDSLGHKAGDELLTQVSKRIRSGVRKSDVVARLCGDEFSVILSEIKFRESAEHLARRLIYLLQQPFHLGGEEVFINASIGISIYPDDGAEAETLIKNADTAMHFAKERGILGSFQHFRPQMNEQLVQRLTLDKQLRHAVDNEEFVLYYQPKYSVIDERMVGAEALIRWQHPQEGLISPAEFIPLAEESGLITALGEWGLKTACNQVKAWEEQGLGLHKVAVNLSSRQFQNRRLLTLLNDTLEETGLPAAFLELEITESAVMEKPEQAVELLREIRRLGISIAIDDFGTGYSSLAYLKKFPVNSIKIDQSFIADLTKDSDDAAIVESIIQMARSLNLEVVAEGVETLEQLEFLREKKCHEVQGYYFSKPLPAEQFAEKILKTKAA